MNQLLKKQLIVLFGRSTVESAIALRAEIKQKNVETVDTEAVITASREIRAIQQPHEKVRYCQGLDPDIQKALIVSMLFP